MLESKIYLWFIITMADVLIINEILCYIMNKYGVSPNEIIKRVVLSFFSLNEVSVAKEQLFKAASEIKFDGDSALPVLVGCCAARVMNGRN